MIKATPKPEKKLTPDQAMVRLETICARAERCTRELRDKLWQWGLSSADAEKIIASLENRKFVDDTRFARAFINDKVKFARWGRRKIRVTLAAKRIDSRVVSQLLEEIDEKTYTDNLLTVMKLKAGTISDPKTYAGRTKLFRHAVSRGYEPELVADLIRDHFS